MTIVRKSQGKQTVIKAQERTFSLPTYFLVTMVDNDARSQQPCSPSDLEEALSVLEGRWKILVLFHLFSNGTMRYSELRRALPGVSQKMLTQQLRELEKEGVVFRTIHAEVPPRVEYGLTRRGGDLLPVLQALQTWAVQRKT